MPTRAPSAASPIAVALPMPPVPPVTRTDFPAIREASAMIQSYPDRIIGTTITGSRAVLTGIACRGFRTGSYEHALASYASLTRCYQVLLPQGTERIAAYLHRDVGHERISVLRVSRG